MDKSCRQKRNQTTGVNGTSRQLPKHHFHPNATYPTISLFVLTALSAKNGLSAGQSGGQYKDATTPLTENAKRMTATAAQITTLVHMGSRVGGRNIVLGMPVRIVANAVRTLVYGDQRFGDTEPLICVGLVRSILLCAQTFSE
jgi:hypothetical protein